MSRNYSIHSAFLTHQGEGMHFGKRAVFIRFSGCNVWSGHDYNRERDAERNSACAKICDTEFVGFDFEQLGGSYEANGVALLARALWGSQAGEAFCVLTGGEPSLQVDHELVAALKQSGFYVAIETNGTKPVPQSVNWIALAPKFPMQIHESYSGVRIDEVKLLSIFLDNPLYVDIARKIPAGHRWVQPVDMLKANKADGDPDSVVMDNDVEVRRAVAFCLKNPDFRLGIQAHKVWNVA